MPSNAEALLYEVLNDESESEALGDDAKGKIAMNWKRLKVDNNNKIIPQISFAFDMVNSMTARLTLTDANNERYSVPE